MLISICSDHSLAVLWRLVVGQVGEHGDVTQDGLSLIRVVALFLVQLCFFRSFFRARRG